MNTISLYLCLGFTLFSLYWNQSDAAASIKAAVPAFMKARKVIKSVSSAAMRSRSSSVSQFTNTFQGCFMPNRARDLHAHRRNKDNLNIRCIDHCRERSYPIAVTSGDLCACSNSLLGITPRVARPDDRNSSGSGSKCNQRCPGTAGSGSCSFDTCCGGKHGRQLAYSVFVVGNIDSVRTVLKRAQSALKKNSYDRLKKLYGNDYPDYTKKPRTRLWGHYTQFVESNPEKCWNRCKVDSRCQASSWSDKNSMAHKKYNCWLFPKTKGRETRQNGWTAYLKGKEKEWENSSGKRLWSHYANFNNMQDALACRQKCLDRREVCGGATYVPQSQCKKICGGCKGNCCFLFKYGAFRATRQSHYTSFVFEQPIVEVETTATSLNAKGETTGKNKCKVASSYTCSASTERNPEAQMVLEVQDMQRMLVHQLGKNLQPLGKFDLEKDNTGGTQPATVTKTITISESSERSWSTESGVDTSYTVGTSVSSTVGAEAFGVSASASVEMSTEFSVGGFFSSGFARTTSTTVEDQISVEYEVPPGQKLLMNFFKETYPLSINWRALMIASGRFRVRFLGKTKILFVSEVLNLNERTIYAFGRIDFGDREKIVSIAKFIDASGDVLSQERSG